MRMCDLVPLSFINVTVFFMKERCQLWDAVCLSYTSLAVTASSTAKPDKKSKKEWERK